MGIGCAKAGREKGEVPRGQNHCCRPVCSWLWGLRAWSILMPRFSYLVNGANNSNRLTRSQ